MAHWNTVLPILACPVSGGTLSLQESLLRGPNGTTYDATDGIPRLLIPSKDEQEEAVRRKMQQFYETVNFPGYDGIDSPAVLMDKAKRSGFGQWLDTAIPPTATVLEVGCGTGQMTNFLGFMQTRQVIGVDQSIPSLTLGNRFARTWNMQNVTFVQGNIFALPIQHSAVDVLICSGVLHHTPDPYGGFKELLKRVKPGGYIIIGLYNRYARIPLGMRKLFFRMTGNAFRAIDAHMRRKDVDDSKKEIWFADQYRNPHESWHSVDEVLRWFRENTVEFTSAVPAISALLSGETQSTMKLFETHPTGGALEHILRQLGWMFTISREGGLYVLVGKKQ